MKLKALGDGDMPGAELLANSETGINDGKLEHQPTVKRELKRRKASSRPMGGT